MATIILKYHNSPYGEHLCRYLYSKSYLKRRRKKKSPRVLIPNRIFIDKRPKIVNLRLEFGHYEGDTVGRPRSVSPETLVVERIFVIKGWEFQPIFVIPILPGKKAQ